MALVRRGADDDSNTALNVWNELKRIYTSSNEKYIWNIGNKLDS